MIKTYNECEKGRTKVFFVVKNNEVTSIKVGNQVVSTDQGFQFYVDDYVAEQISKCELYLNGLTPKLKVKDGETLFIPDENEKYKKEKRIKELEKEIEELKENAE